jgi:hypothetical protein
MNDVSMSMVMMNHVSIKACQCSTLTTTSVPRHDSHSLPVGFLLAMHLFFVVYCMCSCAQTEERAILGAVRKTL